MKLPIATGRAAAREAWRGLRPQGGMLALAVVLLAAAATAALLIPAGLGRLVDAVTGAPTDLTAVVVTLAAGILGSAAAGAAGAMALSAALETSLARLRESFVGAALALPPRLVDELPDGELVSRTTDDVDTVGEVTTDGVPALVGALFAVVATAVGMTLLHPLFLLALLAVVPIHAVALRSYIRRAPRMYAAESAAVAARSRELLAAVRALPTLHAYGWTDRADERIRRRSWNVLRWALQTRRVQNRLAFGMNMAEAVGLVAVLLVGAYIVATGAVTVGQVTTASLFFLALFGPFGILLMLIDDLQAAGASLARIVGVIDLSRSLAREPRATGDADGSGVVVRGLRAGYPDRPDALHGIDLDVAAGEWVAVVGASGAGKTTLARCLTGALVPRSGSVRVAGADPADLDEVSRARRIVMVSQDVHIFSGTLRDNLRIARDDASDAELADALRAVSGEAGDVDLDAEMGDGHDATSALDGHRIALARVLLAHADVVVLDEATADADTADARVLERATRRALQGRAVVTIAHRLSQARDADRVVVLADGRIAEEGTHDALVAAGGAYARLWEAWSAPRG